MAIIKAVKSHGGLKKIIQYVTHDEKTQGRFIDTLNCNKETAVEEMYVTKQMYQKQTGVQYYHFIQSFPPGEKITPEQANEMAKQLAEERWPQYEIVVATHTDRDHLHSHIVVNSVSLEDGKKLHFSPVNLQEMKNRNVEMCKERGLSVPERGREITADNQNKYRAILRASKGDYKSYVLDTAVAASNAKNLAGNQNEFIEVMKDQGYKTEWTDNRKYITFTDQQGHKVRNKNLTKTFKEDFSKEGLAHEFERNTEKQRSGNVDKRRSKGEPGRAFSGKEPESERTRRDEQQKELERTEQQQRKNYRGR